MLMKLNKAIFQHFRKLFFAWFLNNPTVAQNPLGLSATCDHQHIE